MIHPELLGQLRCPETRQKVELADETLVRSLNERIARGELSNRAGRKVKEALEAGLIREDRLVVYPVWHNLPVMLIDEAIQLS